MKKTLLIETSYMPNIEYFCLIYEHENILLEKFEFFAKQTLRNRCLINTSQGIRMLSIPLEGRHGKILTKDVRVETGNKWRNSHWRTLESAYRKAPFFEFYSDALRKIIYQGHELLFDLNSDLLSFCLQSLHLRRPVSETMSYTVTASEMINDLRNCVSGIKSSNSKYKFEPKPYLQVFGNSFASNLSLIDLLFCCGPESFQIIKSSISNITDP